MACGWSRWELRCKWPFWLRYEWKRVHQRWSAPKDHVECNEPSFGWLQWLQIEQVERKSPNNGRMRWGKESYISGHQTAREWNLAQSYRFKSLFEMWQTFTYSMETISRARQMYETPGDAHVRRTAVWNNSVTQTHTAACEAHDSSE